MEQQQREDLKLPTEQKYDRIDLRQAIVLVLSGILIGGGAILPGISGGVLCVIFGIYRPMMEILSHPFKAIPKYWKMFIPVGIGWALGFLIFAKVVDWLFAADAVIAVSLFVGLILGTFPSLWEEAGSEEGHTRGGIISMIIAFSVVAAILFWVQYGVDFVVTPNLFWYLFAGVLWGISLIVPGMSSSSILISLSLYDKWAAGIAALDFSVIIPWGIGLLATVVLLARFVNNLFEKHYAVGFHAVVGVVAASTVVIIPYRFAGIGQFILSVVCFIAGIFLALLFSKKPKDAEE